VSALAEIDRDVERALARQGMAARRTVLVSPLGERKGVRFAYRVELEDGRTVKARHFGNEAAARRVLELHRGLEAAFARPLARDGPVLLEEWIDGVPLSDREAEARAGEAGALLGRLHATPLGAEVPPTANTGGWRAGAEADLALLGDAGMLAAGEVAALRAELHGRDPGVARAVLIHRDFCAENMLLDHHGRLRIIDNEQLDIAPADYDLGRTFHRWPMADAAWARFLRAYCGAAPSEPAALGFWRIVASLETTRVFLQRLPVRLDASLALLRRFANGEGLDGPS
jgi:Ser/Thr protein kinase RdoA (MazF antagonist)